MARVVRSIVRGGELAFKTLWIILVSLCVLSGLVVMGLQLLFIITEWE